MVFLFGGLVAMALAAPAGDPRAIDPAANRPEIVAPGGAPTKAKPVKTRPPKVEPKTELRSEPKVEPKPQPKLGLGSDPKVEPKTQPDAEPEPEPEIKPEPAAATAPAVADGPQERCFPARGRCRRLNVAGIVAASVGVGMLGTGIGFMQAPQFPVPDEPIFNRSLRSPGVVLVALGAVTTVAGVLMIVVGHASHGKGNREARTARVRLVPGGLQW